MANDQINTELEQEYQKRDELEAKFEAEYPEGFDQLYQEIEAL